MLKILIIEDEIPARKKIKRFLEQSGTAIDIVAEIDTVVCAIAFLEKHKVDMIFSDIELLDGNAFDIYRHVAVDCPIIFTTAYDAFWMNAFENNGIEYLLKPFTQERFQKAWDKFLMLMKSNSSQHDVLAQLQCILENNLTEKTYKKRFTVSTHKGIYFINTDDILFFGANGGVVFAHDKDGKKHLLNETSLSAIEQQLHPTDFFRVNRSELVHKKYIQKVERYSKNSLAIKMKNYDENLKTSQSNTHDFRVWLER